MKNPIEDNIIEKKNNGSIHKKIAQGLLWMSFIYVILCAFICLLLWGLLSLAVHIK